MCVGWFVGFFVCFCFLHQFGGVTNKLQTKICQLCSLYSTATVTHYPQRGELPLMRRRSHHLEISSATVSEEKRELKIK